MTITKSIRLTPLEANKWDSKTIHSFLQNGSKTFDQDVKHTLRVKNLILEAYLKDIIFLFDILNTKAKWKRMPKEDDPIWDTIERIDKYVKETKTRND